MYDKLQFTVSEFAELMRFLHDFEQRLHVLEQQQKQGLPIMTPPPPTYTRGQEVEVKRNHYWVKALYLHKNGSHFVYIPDLLDEGTCWVSDNEIRPLQKESK